MKGFDTWGQGLTPAQARAAGFGFRTWYSSHDSSKDGPASGPADYAKAGLWSVANFETTTSRVLTGGYAGGQQDMTHAVNEYVPRGMPPGAAVILSADEAIPAGAFPQALAYYQGARQAAAGRYLAGCYGEQALIAYLKGHGAIEIGWRSMSTAWPGGASTAYCDLVQTGSAVIDGIEVDLDQALVPFFGQWMPGRLAPAAPAATPVHHLEHEMILHDITGSPEVWALSGSLYWHVADPASLTSYVKAGVPRATISAAEHATILAGAQALKAPSVTLALPKSFTLTPGS
jgi:hypothetical protein